MTIETAVRHYVTPVSYTARLPTVIYSDHTHTAAITATGAVSRVGCSSEVSVLNLLYITATVVTYRDSGGARMFAAPPPPQYQISN